MKAVQANVVLIVLGMFLLSACTESRQLVFSGASESWSVRYEVNIIDENSESTGYLIQYIGDGPNPEQIKYVIDSSSGSGEGLLDERGVLKMAGGSCDGCSITREDQKMEAVIEWNGRKETIPLVLE